MQTYIVCSQGATSSFITVVRTRVILLTADATMFRRTLAWRSAARVAATAAIGAFAAPALCEPRQGPPTSLAAKRPPSIVTFTGGAGAESHPSITLEYFALRGLGELPRLILEATGTPYNSVFHFGESKYKEYAAFGQLPVLRDSELGNLLLVQSAAIARHLARKLCIDGSTPEEKAKIDMYYELSRDISSKTAAVYDPKHADAQKLSAFLFAAEEACRGEHFVGNSLTLADCAMFHTLYTLVELRPDALERYDRLSAFVSAFAKQPAIAAYLDSERRVPLTINELKQGPHQGLPGYKFVSPLRVGTYATPWQGPA